MNIPRKSLKSISEDTISEIFMLIQSPDKFGSSLNNHSQFCGFKMNLKSLYLLSYGKKCPSKLNNFKNVDTKWINSQVPCGFKIKSLKLLCLLPFLRCLSQLGGSAISKLK